MNHEGTNYQLMGICLCSVSLRAVIDRPAFHRRRAVNSECTFMNLAHRKQSWNILAFSSGTCVTVGIPAFRLSLWADALQANASYLAFTLGIEPSNGTSSAGLRISEQSDKGRHGRYFNAQAFTTCYWQELHPSSLTDASHLCSIRQANASGILIRY